MKLSLLIKILLVTIFFACQSRQLNDTKKIVLLYETGKYDSLISMLTKKINQNRQDTFSIYYLAKTYLSSKNYSASLQTLERIKSVGEWKYKFLEVKHQTYYDTENYSEALKAVDTLIFLKPDNPNLYLDKAITHYNIYTNNNDDKQLKEALSSVNTTLQLAPSNVKAIQFRGVIRFGYEDYFGAINDLNSYISTEKKDSASLGQAYRFLGNSYYSIKKFDTALSKFDTAILYSPKNGRIYYDRADVLLALKKKDAACKDFSQALELGIFVAADDIKKNCN